MLRRLLVTALVLLPSVAVLAEPQGGPKPAKGGAGPSAAADKGAEKGSEKADEPKRIALSYLKALEGRGDDTARSYLLGGLTLTAEDFRIPNWKIVSRDEPRIEVASIKEAVEGMRALDKAGRSTLTQVVNLEGEEAVLELSQEQAEKMMAPTRQKAEAFQKKFPVFSYVARVGKDVFWHPANPWRGVVDEMGLEGTYRLELHRFNIEEKEPGQKPRVWPLRVLRIQTKSYDSGWKILPASDWDPEY